MMLNPHATRARVRALTLQLKNKAFHKHSRFAHCRPRPEAPRTGLPTPNSLSHAHSPENPVRAACPGLSRCVFRVPGAGMIARHERMRLGPGLPVFTIGMHADTARCLLQAPDHDAEIGRPPPPSAGSGPPGPP